MRTLSKMTTAMDTSFIFERLHEMIPPILSNLKESITVASNNNNNNNNAGNDHLMDKSILNHDDEYLLSELLKKKSLNDMDVIVTYDHLRWSSIHFISAIARTANLSNVRSLMKPIVDFLDRHDAWQFNNFAKLIMKNIISNGWSHSGYYLVSFLIQHLDNYMTVFTGITNNTSSNSNSGRGGVVAVVGHSAAIQQEQQQVLNNSTRRANIDKKQIFNIIIYIIGIQSKKSAVGTSALEAVISLVRLLMVCCFIYTCHWTHDSNQSMLIILLTFFFHLQ
jgi:hypothetical protein